VAARKKLIPAAVIAELATVEGLKRGRSNARETDPVRPVPQEHIDAVLGVVGRHVAGLIRLQLLTAARPGELLGLRRADIDTAGPVWVFRPNTHKNKHRGGGGIREIYLGPQAQEVLKEFFRPELDCYLFSPARAREERFAALRARRKSKVPPGQLSRRKAVPKVRPGERYTTHSYRLEVVKACKSAGGPARHPHPLRHNAATALRKQFGVELARIILGHQTVVTTEIYAEADKTQAIEVVAKNG
jgi:integrase